MLPLILQYKLLEWYEINGRSLPWRIKGKPHNNPYVVWISEVMLQQTTVKTVIPYFTHFLEKWPSIKMLAKTEQGEVLQAWHGLGYYNRARRLYLCSRVIVNDRDGYFPRKVSELETLPGIGPYTARAIAAIAFNIPVIPIDSNIARVLTRFSALQGKRTPTRLQTKNLSSQYQVIIQPYDLSQALMDLGSAICRPKNPLCCSCPLASSCLSALEDESKEKKT